MNSVRQPIWKHPYGPAHVGADKLVGFGIRIQMGAAIRDVISAEMVVPIIGLVIRDLYERGI